MPKQKTQPPLPPEWLSDIHQPAPVCVFLDRKGPIEVIPQLMANAATQMARAMGQSLVPAIKHQATIQEATTNLNLELKVTVSWDRRARKGIMDMVAITQPKPTKTTKPGPKYKIVRP